MFEIHVSAYMKCKTALHTLIWMASHYAIHTVCTMVLCFILAVFMILKHYNIQFLNNHLITKTKEMFITLLDVHIWSLMLMIRLQTKIMLQICYNFKIFCAIFVCVWGGVVLFFIQHFS